MAPNRKPLTIRELCHGEKPRDKDMGFNTALTITTSKASRIHVIPKANTNTV
jgi:hypothetical protein